jgi:hypothetical protein
MTFGACVAYLVDVMHSRSSEILATIEFVLFIYQFGIQGLNEHPWLLAYCVLL